MKVTLVLIAAVLAVAHASDCSFCGPYDVTAKTLPDYVGESPIPFASSTGYVNVNATDDRYNFYWLVESMGDPATDPLIFWYQGGPGCSGLLGLFTEHGPFRVQPDGTVDLAQYTWNQYASIVYLEQPTGVGFSFDPDSGHKYTSNDFQSAVDNYNFVEGFLAANPRFVGNPTWLLGESYGGVYIPSLANQILAHPGSTIYNQYKGMMLGNPVISCDSLNNRDVVVNMFYWHGLMSYRTYKAWNDAGCKQSGGSLACTELYVSANTEVGQIYQELGAFSFNGTQPSLDPDSLYQDFITGNASLEWTLSTLDDQQETFDSLTADYLNRKDVQQAIHAMAPPSGEWSTCVSPLFLRYKTSGLSMIPYYQEVISQRPDVSILVYSGDTDIATVPFGQTELCLAELDGITKESWTPWFVNGATAGYIEQYKEYSFATVKGAGHTVPEYQPFNSIELFRRFLQNQNLDGGEVYFPPPGTKNRKRKMRQGDVLRRTSNLIRRLNL